jgi:hypothetical protein
MIDLEFAEFEENLVDKKDEQLNIGNYQRIEKVFILFLHSLYKKSMKIK